MSVLAHVLAAVGMIGIAFLPDILPNHYLGLAIPTIVAAVGSGFIEIVISPIVEACPTKKKNEPTLFCSLTSKPLDIITPIVTAAIV